MLSRRKRRKKKLEKVYWLTTDHEDTDNPSTTVLSSLMRSCFGICKVDSCAQLNSMQQEIYLIVAARDLENTKI